MDVSDSALGSGEEPSGWEVLTVEKWQRGTIVVAALAFFSQFTGVPALPIVSSTLFAQLPNLPNAVGVYLITVVGVIGASIGPFLQKFAAVRTILLVGYCAMTVCLLLITLFFILDVEVLTLIFMSLLQLVY